MLYNMIECAGCTGAWERVQLVEAVGPVCVFDSETGGFTCSVEE